MMYLILGESDKASEPKDLYEKKESWLRMIENVRKEVHSGELKMVGINPNGSRFFFVSAQDPKTIFAKQAAAPNSANYEVIPMLSLDEAEEVIKGL